MLKSGWIGLGWKSLNEPLVRTLCGADKKSIMPRDIPCWKGKDKWSTELQKSPKQKKVHPCEIFKSSWRCLSSQADCGHLNKGPSRTRVCRDLLWLHTVLQTTKATWHEQTQFCLHAGLIWMAPLSQAFIYGPSGGAFANIVPIELLLDESKCKRVIYCSRSSKICDADQMGTSNGER